MTPTLNRKLIWFVIAFGIICQTSQYLYNRSLWLDEAALALKVRHFSYAELIQPQTNETEPEGIAMQSSPLGFLFLTKLLTESFGDSEYILRLISLICALGAIILFYKVTGYFLNPFGRILALAFFVMSQHLIFYGSEFKSYSVDVFVVLLLVFIYLRTLRENFSWPQTVFAGTAFAVAVWFSFPSLFVVGAIGLSMVFSGLTRKDNVHRVKVISLHSFWVLSFFFYYSFYLRTFINDEPLGSYWQGNYLPLHPQTADDFKWYYRHFLDMFQNPGGLELNVLCGILFIIGSISLFRKRKHLAWMSGLIFLLTAMASGFKLYPFSGRLILFLVPFLYIALAEGLERSGFEMLRAGKKPAYLFMAILLSAVFFYPMKTTIAHLFSPQLKAEIKPAIEFMRNNKVPIDKIYVYYNAVPAYRYYAEKRGGGDMDYVAGVKSRKDPQNYFDDIEKLKGEERVWFLFSNIYQDEEKIFLNYLDRVGLKVKQYRGVNASTYLYNLGESPKADN